MGAAIETSALVRRFRRTDAVNGLTMQVPAGGVFALIGPNGAGKTTTIKVLMNLLRPSAGSATVLGVDSRRLGVPELQRIGYVSENQRLPDWMSPRQLLEYCRPFYPGWDAAFAAHLQRALGLTSDAPLRHLSRGTRMKAAVLVSLAYRPELIVLDEPFTGLDPSVRDELIRALLEACGDRRWTVLVSSHDVDDVERLADTVGFIADGRLLFAEPTAAILARFRSVEVVVDAADARAKAEAERSWIVDGVSGRTLRFIDTAHDNSGPSRIGALFPGSAVTVAPMPLREIFVALARARERRDVEVA